MATSIGVGAPKLITRLMMSPGSKEKGNVRHLLRKAMPQALAQHLHRQSSALAQLHLQNALLGPAVPQVDEVDRIGRPVHTDQRQGQFDRLRTRLIGNDPKRLLGVLHRVRELRAGRRADAQLQLAGLGTREDVRSETRPQQSEQHSADKQVHSDDLARMRDEPPQQQRITGLQACEAGGRRSASCAAAARDRKAQTREMGTSVLAST